MIHLEISLELLTISLNKNHKNKSQYIMQLQYKILDFKIIKDLITIPLQIQHLIQTHSLHLILIHNQLLIHNQHLIIILDKLTINQRMQNSIQMPLSQQIII